MIKKWKHAPDKDKNVYAIFIDISKAFDTLNHNLLLAKLDSYSISFNAKKNSSKIISRNNFKSKYK